MRNSRAWVMCSIFARPMDENIWDCLVSSPGGERGFRFRCHMWPAWGTRRGDANERSTSKSLCWVEVSITTCEENGNTTWVPEKRKTQNREGIWRWKRQTRGWGRQWNGTFDYYPWKIYVTQPVLTLSYLSPFFLFEIELERRIVQQRSWKAEGTLADNLEIIFHSASASCLKLDNSLSHILIRRLVARNTFRW